MNKPLQKITSRLRWQLMSDRERYAQLWAKSRANWDIV
jgi:hypothetical protein